MAAGTAIPGSPRTGRRSWGEIPGSPRTGLRSWGEQEPMTMPLAEDVATQDFAAIVASHRPQVFRFLLASTRELDLAETLTQETFLKAHRHWSSFRGESSAITWLMRIAI